MDDSWQKPGKMFDINVWSLAAMTRAVLRGLRQRCSGTVINLSPVGIKVLLVGPDRRNCR